MRIVILDGYTVELDAANPPEGDSAWFIIQADDIDSLEKALRSSYGVSAR